jgi:hypothetical protein
MLPYGASGGYNPASIMGQDLQLRNYLSDQLLENSTMGYRRALGNPPSAVNVASGVVAGALLGKLIWDIIDGNY